MHLLKYSVLLASVYAMRMMEVSEDLVRLVATIKRLIAPRPLQAFP